MALFSIDSLKDLYDLMMIVLEKKKTKQNKTKKKMC